MLTFGDQLTTKVGITQYKRLVEAAEFYESRGFKYIDVPWLVQQKVCNSTKPRSSRPIHHHVDALNHTFHIVASGEQSFLQMQYERAKFGQPLMTGRYQTITPCYRDETVIDDQHRIGFVKLELIDWDNQTQGNLANIILTAFEFYKKYIPVQAVRNDLQHENGIDIQSLNTGIELGSYGIRSADIRGFKFNWIYATGLAEPRLSYALEQEVTKSTAVGNL